MSEVVFKRLLISLALLQMISVTAHGAEIFKKEKNKVIAMVNSVLPNRDFDHELDLNAGHGEFVSSQSTGRSVSDLNLLLAYHKNMGADLKDGVQLGGRFGLRSFDSKSYVTLVGLATYNFASPLVEAPFIEAGLGTYPLLNSSQSVDNKFGFELSYGHRFEIRKHLAYKPYISITKKGSLDPDLTISFFNFSVCW